MSIIEPVEQNPLHPSETRRYSLSLRLWHWLNLLVISGSLITVLINSTLMDKKVTNTVIAEQAAKGGTILPADTANQIAHELEDSVWNVHAYIGFALVALLLWRIIYEIVSPASQSFFRKVSVARLALKNGGVEAQLARHELVVKVLYFVFYLVIILMGITGLTLYFKHDLGLDKSVSHSIQEFHSFCMYLVILFIVVHVAGVILAEHKQSPGIVSAMINGGSN